MSRSVPPSARTLLDALSWRVAQHPERLCARFLIEGEVDGAQELLRFGALERRAKALAATLSDTLSPGDRALLIFAPSLDFLVAWWGCLFAGVVAVPTSPPDPSRLQRALPRLSAIVEDCGASMVLSQSAIAGFAQSLGDAAPALSALPWLSVDTLDEAEAHRWRAPALTPDSPAFLQYTSGSTGQPKGVVVTHHNVLTNTRQIAESFELTRGEGAMVCWLPMFHDMGLIGNIAYPNLAGREVVWLSPVDFIRRPMRWLEAISHYRATLAGGPNFGWALTARKARPEELAGLDLSCLTTAFTGAEPVRASTLRRFAEVFSPCGFDPQSFLPCYGLAEATLFVSGARGLDEGLHHLDADALSRGRARPVGEGASMELMSHGEPVGDTRVAIVDPETLILRDADEVGEIWVSGGSVAGGYWGRLELSEATFGARLPGDSEPWLRTGDLGLLRGGELLITGRLKDLIIARGRNLYPQDIEALAEAAHPALRLGGSAAVSVPSGVEEGIGLVAELRGPPGPELPELIARLREAVAEGCDAPLCSLLLLPPRALPKTTSGKVQRQAARALLLDATQDGFGRWQAPKAIAAPPPTEHSPALTQLITWLERRGLGPADPARSLAAHGVDSVGLAELSGELSAAHGPLPLEIFYGRSLRALAQDLSARGRGDVHVTPHRPLREVGALEPKLRPSAPPRPHSSDPACLLLTGATGFLGANLLRELLLRCEADVICLVRSKDAAEALHRVRSTLQRRGLWQADFAGRLRALPGDLAAPRFGWTEARFERIAHQVEGVWHCAAQVNWGAPLSALEAVNVGGTREAIRLACAAGGAPLHFVSSLGVYPLGLGEPTKGEVFAEQGPPEGEALLRVGYFQSKWAAEHLVHEAGARGLPVSVYRPAFVGGDSRSGEEPEGQGQLLCAFMQGCVAMGLAPRVDKVLDIVPVDFVAAAIAAMSLDPRARGRSFNLCNRRPMRQRALYAQLRRRGYALQESGFAQWREAALALPPSSGNPLVRFQGYYRQLTPEQMTVLERQMSQRSPVEDSAAQALLAALGLRCPAADEALMGRSLDVYVASGAMSPPPPQPVASTSRGIEVPAAFVSTLVEDYQPENNAIHRLYGKAKRRQWDAELRIDWSLPLDPRDPAHFANHALPLFGSPLWRKLNASERADLRHHYQAWQFSQYLHGEQGALLASSKLVQQVPSVEAKLFAASQVMDEARHLEVFTRLVDGHIGLRYEICSPLTRLLEQVLGDGRWDMSCLGMQVLIEGLALAAFAAMRGQSAAPLVLAANAAVMEDEARHMAYGRLLLAEHYGELSERERGEREAFVIEACYLLRDRFQAEQVWERLGLPVSDCVGWLEQTGQLQRYRAELFSRVVPTVKAIGLWSPAVRRAFDQMGILHFAELDTAALLSEDRALIAASK